MAQLIYRALKSSDINEVTSMAVRYAKALYPNMRPDTSKITAVLRECLQNKGNFAEVAVQDGKIKAVLVALVHDALWAERKIANIVGWISESAGAGRALMRRLIAWAAPKRAIKLIGLATMSDSVVLTCYTVLHRMGFTCEGGSLVRYN